MNLRFGACVSVLSVLAVSGSARADGNAFADNVLAVHGWGQNDPTQAQCDEYWNRNHSFSSSFNDQTSMLCGTPSNPSPARCNSGQTFDVCYRSASTTWDDTSDNGATCQIVDALYSQLGTNMAIMAHSNGSLGAVNMVAAAQQGFSSKYACTGNGAGGSPATAMQWVQRVFTMGAPFLGTTIANAVTGGSSSCTNEAKLLSWLFPIVNNNAVKHLTTTYMGGASGWSYLKNSGSQLIVTNYGTQAACGTNGSTTNNPSANCGGGNSSVMCLIQSICNVGTNNDGIINQASATGSSPPNNFSVGYSGGYNHLSMADGSCTTTNNVINGNPNYDWGTGMWDRNYY